MKITKLKVFTSEFLNEINCSGIPNHRLRLKVGVPIMLLRNIDQDNGLCNRTRLQVIDLKKNVICGAVLTWSNIGDKIFISRMNLIPSYTSIPFKFRRRKFPVALCFEMTINKAKVIHWAKLVYIFHVQFSFMDNCMLLFLELKRKKG